MANNDVARDEKDRPKYGPSEFAKAWDQQELVDKRAINDGAKLLPPNLQGQVLPIFQEERWSLYDQNDGVYRTLEQSLILASRIVEAAVPYLASFLPADKLYDPKLRHINEEDVLAPHEKDDFSKTRWPSFISIKTPTEKECVEAFEELEHMSEYIRWQTNANIYDVRGWRGITMCKDDTPTTYSHLESLDPGQEIPAASFPRNLYVVIMSQYVEAIRNSPIDSEQHLRATFMAAITIVHELGHAIFYSDYRAAKHPFSKFTYREPYVAGGCAPELGDSFIAWIFGGSYVPEVINFGDEEALKLLETPLYWKPLDTGYNQRPFYKHCRSLSTGFLQRILTNRNWNNLGPRKTLRWVRGALGLLRGDLFGQDVFATAVEPNYQWQGGNIPGDPGAIYWRGVPGNTYRNDNEFGRGKLCRPQPSSQEIEKAEQWRTAMGIENIYFSNKEVIQDDEEAIFRGRGTATGEDEEGVTKLQMEPPGRNGARQRAVNKGNERWTRIEVKYRPWDDTGSTKNRKRSRDEETSDESTAKKPRTNYFDLKNLVRAFKTINLFREWTFEEGKDLCINNGLGSLPVDIEDEDSFHRQIGPYDHILMERIQNWKIQSRLRKDFKGNGQSELAFKKLSAKFVDRWDKPDLLQFCAKSNLQADVNTTKNNLLTMVRDYQKQEILDLEHAEGSLPAEVEELIQVEGWGEREIRAYCSDHNLPDPYTIEGQNKLRWLALDLKKGPVQTHVAAHVVKDHMIPEIVKKFEDAERIGLKDRPRDGNGDFVFKYKAVLGQTRTQTLVNALAAEVNPSGINIFPEGSQLQLFFERGGRQDVLRNAGYLNEYNRAAETWKMLRLVILAPLLGGPGPYQGLQASARPLNTNTPAPSATGNTSVPDPGQPPRQYTSSSGPPRPLGDRAKIETQAASLYRPLQVLGQLSGGRRSDAYEIRDMYNQVVNNVRAMADLPDLNFSKDSSGSSSGDESRSRSRSR